MKKVLCSLLFIILASCSQSERSQVFGKNTINDSITLSSFDENGNEKLKKVYVCDTVAVVK